MFSRQGGVVVRVNRPPNKFIPMKIHPIPFLLLAAASVALADEIRLDACPPAVQQVIQANLRDGKLDEIEAHRVDDRTLYVAKIDLPGDRDLDVHVSGDGRLLKTNEDVPESEVPAAVAGAIKNLTTTTGGRLEDVEREVADGKTTYHAEIDRPNAADLEVVFAEDGALISQTEETND